MRSPKHSADELSPAVLVLVMIFGCAIALGLHTLLWSPNPLNDHIEGLVIIWAGFFGVLFLCKNLGLFTRPVFNTSSNTTLFFWLVTLGLGLVFRFQVLLAEPYLADDYQRYLFDGNLILAGINPYAATPLSFPELGGADIPKPEIKTIYPPLAEGLFAIASWIGGTLWHWRLLNLIPDVLGATIFYRLLKRRALPGHWIILWLWNPLILKEGLHAAHLDIWTLLAVLLFVYWAEQGRWKVAALSLGAAVLLKLIPLVLLPAWLTQLSSLRERLIAVGVIAGTLAAGFACFLPWHPFGNIAVFVQHIQGYGVLFQFLGQGMGLWQLDTEWVKWLLSSLGGALLLHWVLALRRYHARAPSQLLELFLMLYVFSSMGFPWYLLPALPWVLIHGHWLWMLFVALSQLVFYAHQLQTPSAILTGISMLVLILAVYQQRVKNDV